MTTKIRYGRKRSLEVRCDQLVRGCLPPHGRPLQDPVAAVRQALAEPLDYPPIQTALLPDDRVVLVLEEGLCCAAELLKGVVESLQQVGLPPENITVLRSKRDRANSPRRIMRLFEPALRERIAVVEFDATDEKSRGYLAASKDGQPILVSRTLCEADVVIPLSSARSGHSHEHLANLQQDQEQRESENHDQGQPDHEQRDHWQLGIHHGWYPAFADLDTQRRFRKSQASLSPREMRKRREECEEAAWKLGVMMCIQVVPGGHDRAIHVLAGSPEAVSKQGNRLANEVWQFEPGPKASLVVATIGGGPEQHTWSNVSRAVESALAAVDNDGAIVVCTQLRTPPGPALRRFAQAGDFEAGRRAIRRKPSRDAIAAVRLNNALQQTRLYLLSGLNENDVEDLGIAYIADPQEVTNLSLRHPSCTVLENAQFLSPSAGTRFKS